MLHEKETTLDKRYVAMMAWNGIIFQGASCSDKCGLQRTANVRRKAGAVTDGRSCLSVGQLGS